MRLTFTASCLFAALTSSHVQGFIPVKSHTKSNTAMHAEGVEYSDIVGDLLQKLQGSTNDASSLLSSVKFPSVDGLLPSGLPSMGNLMLEVPSSLLDAQQFLTDLQPYLQENFPEIVPAYQSFLTALQQTLDSPQAVVETSVIVIASTCLITLLVAPFTRGDVPDQPYPNQRYNPQAAKAYFDARPGLVLSRGLTVLTRSLTFAATALGDYLKDQRGETIPEYVAEQRGRELATLLCALGSTYIKVGQSLSIRTDLLSPPYIRGLATLQDQVPPFDSTKAFEMIEAEWGRPITQIVSDITPEPVASASLGQVYKATMKESGMEVAIKVQRPDIMEQIALDMYLLREYIAVTVKTLGNLNSDTVGTVDAWGLGFVDELNYVQEAKNAQFFTQEIGKTPLKDVVFSPAVVEEYSTNQVLVTEWVDGERLDKSSKEDVTTLCSIAMNTYLTMLLEIGMLHCDPHPGNLLRTTDGKLAVLDWGMITILDKDLQLTLIEHMAHLTSADYDEVPRDLLLLGFIPADKSHLINDSGVVEVLAGIYGTWSAGGGVAAFNVNDVINEMQELTSKKGNLFQIPPYFAYIAKSFSVLEGIGLTNDPQYSIVNECMPYVSQRLLTDSKSMKSALNTFIFGPEKNSDYRIVDYDRVEQLVTGFGDYTTSASGALSGQENLSRTQMLESAADQLLDLVFTQEETPLQDILLEQMAKITAASSRSIWTEIRERSGTLPSGRTLLGTLVDPIGLWRTSPLVRMNELDDRTVDTTRKLLALAQRQAQSSASSSVDFSTLSQGEVIEVSSMLVRKVWSKRSGVLQTGGRFARKLLELTANKLERGERDSRKLPPVGHNALDTPFPPQLTEKTKGDQAETPAQLSDPKFKTEQPVRSTPRVEISREKQRRKPIQVSSRLQDARQRLGQLEKDD